MTDKAVEEIKKVFEAIPMATAEQVEELYRLIGKTKMAVETLVAWKKKAQVERFSQMQGEIIQKCIDFLKSKEKIDGN